MGRDRLCVVDSDELFSDFATGLPQVLEHLGLDPWLPDTFEQRNARPRTKLEPELRRRLEDYFAPYDERLATWWGRAPGWRRDR